MLQYLAPILSAFTSGGGSGGGSQSDPFVRQRAREQKVEAAMNAAMNEKEFMLSKAAGGQQIFSRPDIRENIPPSDAQRMAYSLYNKVIKNNRDGAEFTRAKIKQTKPRTKMIDRPMTESDIEAMKQKVSVKQATVQYDPW